MKDFSIQSIKQLLPRFQQDMIKVGWKQAFEGFKQQCHKVFKNLFITEKADSQMIQLIYLHPRIVNNWSR